LKRKIRVQYGWRWTLDKPHAEEEEASKWAKAEAFKTPDATAAATSAKERPR
jgi:hypothetical protein